MEHQSGLRDLGRSFFLFLSSLTRQVSRLSGKNFFDGKQFSIFFNTVMIEIINIRTTGYKTVSQGWVPSRLALDIIQYSFPIDHAWMSRVHSSSTHLHPAIPSGGRLNQMSVSINHWVRGTIFFLNSEIYYMPIYAVPERNPSLISSYFHSP